MAKPMTYRCAKFFAFASNAACLTSFSLTAAFSGPNTNATGQLAPGDLAPGESPGANCSASADNDSDLAGGRMLYSVTVRLPSSRRTGLRRSTSHIGPPGLAPGESPAGQLCAGATSHGA